ncbi:hypothetical protein KCP73_14935 [Salmonella enterica subsp. enterica]|nr:hypothetical protein KCP73_14935 [Salmonella enterica subsp. enterica]
MRVVNIASYRVGQVTLLAFVRSEETVSRGSGLAEAARGFGWKLMLARWKVRVQA